MNQWSKKVKEKLQKKNGEHKNLRAVLFELSKDDGYVIKPIRLICIFYDWLKENHTSTMNAQQARNLAEVYCALSHIFFIAAEKYNIKSAFTVSKKFWDKLKIRQAALENSIILLKEMELIDYYNHCYNNDPSKRKRYYKLNRQMLEFRINEFRKSENRTSQIDELDFDGWDKYKGKKTKIYRSTHTSNYSHIEQHEPEPTDYDDINDMLDDGWYFC